MKPVAPVTKTPRCSNGKAAAAGPFAGTFAGFLRVALLRRASAMKRAYGAPAGLFASSASAADPAETPLPQAARSHKTSGGRANDLRSVVARPDAGRSREDS